MISDLFKLKKDRKIFILVISILTLVAIFINIKIHSNFYYNKQYKDYIAKIKIVSIDLSNSIANHEIIGVLNSMAKRSVLLNEITQNLLPLDSPLLLSKS